MTCLNLGSRGGREGLSGTGIAFIWTCPSQGWREEGANLPVVYLPPSTTRTIPFGAHAALLVVILVTEEAVITTIWINVTTLFTGPVFL